MLEVVLRCLHLSLVSLAVGLPVYCIALDLIRHVDASWRRRHWKLAILAIVGLVGGGLSGLLYGVWLWSPRLSGALTAIGSRLTFGIVEFCFTLVIYIAYALSFSGRAAPSQAWRLFRAAMLFIAFTNLAYHFPTLLGVVRHLRDLNGSGILSSSQFRQFAFSTPILLGSLHFLSSAFVLSGFVTTAALRAEPSSHHFLRVLALISLTLTLGQWFTGFALYGMYPRNLQFELTFLWRWGGFPLMIATAWILTVSQIGLIVAPRSGRWLALAGASLAVLLIQVSGLGAVG